MNISCNIFHTPKKKPRTKKIPLMSMEHAGVFTRAWGAKGFCWPYYLVKRGEPKEPSEDREIGKPEDRGKPERYLGSKVNLEVRRFWGAWEEGTYRAKSGLEREEVNE